MTSSSGSISSLRGAEKDRALPNVTLHIHAEDPTTEIFVINGAFGLSRRAVGDLIARLPRALYKLKLRNGSQAAEYFLSLAEGQEKLMGHPSATLALPAPDTINVSFPAAGSILAVAPLTHSLFTHQEHELEAQIASAESPLRIGQGGTLFLFQRVWTRPAPPSSQPRRGPGVTWERLSLHRLDGSRLVDVDRQTREARQRAWTEEPSAGLVVELDPGAYILRRVQGGLAIEQTVIVSHGWQTQVFLLHSPNRPVEVSIHLARVGEEFRPDAIAVRLAELTRSALTDRRRAMSQRTLRDVLTHQSGNPMLGLYAGHLLRHGIQDQRANIAPDSAEGEQAPRNPRELLREIIKSLRNILPGQHPDIDALALLLEPARAEARFGTPPMFLDSWSLLLETSVDVDNIIEGESLAAQVSTHLFGQGPWMTWEKPKGTKRSSQLFEQAAGRLSDLLGSITRSLPRQSPRDQDLPLHALQALVASGKGHTGQVEDRRRLVRMLGLPPSVIARAAAIVKSPGPPKRAPTPRSTGNRTIRPAAPGRLASPHKRRIEKKVLIGKPAAKKVAAFKSSQARPVAKASSKPVRTVAKAATKKPSRKTYARKAVARKTAARKATARKCAKKGATPQKATPRSARK